MPTTAIEVLLRYREELVERHQQELAQIDRDISHLRQRESSHLKETPTPVRPGQYRGVKAAEAMKSYLNERGGGPIAFDTMAHDLRAGGLEVGSGKHPDRYDRQLKGTISNNAKIFRYNDDTDTVELVNRVRRLA